MSSQRRTASPGLGGTEYLLPQSRDDNLDDVEFAAWRDGKPRLAYLSRAVSPQAILRLLSFIRPSFMSKRKATIDAAEKVPYTPRHSTEYLDGVRGVASLIVFILHWSHMSYPSVNSGWGYRENKSFLLLPFIRILFSGASMVSVFFVVSGFVLSHRFIQRMHRGEYSELYTGLTSITFRRAIRLYLPAFVSSLMAFVAACFGLIVIPKRIDGIPFEHGLDAYVRYLDSESNPWNWELDFSGFYNPQLWSIAVEFRGSMIVFLLVLSLAKTRTVVRLAVEGFLVAHSFAHKRWDLALFIAGMALAELQVLYVKNSSLSRSRIFSVALYVTMIFGIFLSGYPKDHNTETPGYMWTGNLWPYSSYRRRFWLAISAMLIVGPLTVLPRIQSFFLISPVRYLGRISYALYLVHGLGNRSIGKWLLHRCWETIGKEGTWPYALSFVVSSSIYFPMVIWLSDIFWRAIDIPSTDIAKWLERKCSARNIAK